MADIKKTSIFSLCIMYSIVIIFTILAVYPIFWVFIQSFKTTQEYLTTSKLGFPQVWFYQNYPITWTAARFGTLIINSIIYTSVTVVTTILLSFMAGFAFAKIPCRFTPLFHGVFIIGILLTLQ